MIDKLEFLLALAREKHFGRAAEACGVTQPTLSAGVKQIEEMVGVLLVNRGSRFHGFTPEGERVLEWARRIVSDVRCMREEVNGLRHGVSGLVRLATIPSMLGMVARLTTPFRERYPNVRFSVAAKTSAEILDLLENVEVDAGLTYIGNEPIGRVIGIPLYREDYRLITTADAPLGDRQKVTWAEVARVPLCLPTLETQQRRIVEKLLRADGAVPDVILESNAMIVLYTHVKTGRCATIMPEQAIAALDFGEAVKSIPIAEPLISPTVGLIVPARDPMTPLCGALVAEARRISQQIEP